MANNGKYLGLTSGRVQEEAGIATSAGAADAGKIIKLDGAGKIDATFLPVGVGVDVRSVTTSEALAAGDFVNLWSSTGLKARKADATVAGKEAQGFVLVSVSSGATASVYSLDGINSAVSGKTVGARQYLSTTPGLSQETAPAASGNVLQLLGLGLSATEILVESYDGIILA